MLRPQWPAMVVGIGTKFSPVYMSFKHYERVVRAVQALNFFAV